MIGNQKIRLERVSSTNDHCNLVMRERRVEEGTVFFALEQWAGRGQPGNQWVSGKMQNLTFSIALYPSFLPAGSAFALNQWASLSIVRFLEEYGHASMPGISVKWPNDIMIGEKKIAGILIENVIQGGNIVQSVAGIGLNLNQRVFPSGLDGATSLALETGRLFDLEESLDALCLSLSILYDALRANEPFCLAEAYDSHLFEKGRWRRFMINGKKCEGNVRGVDEGGRLLLSMRDGHTLALQFQEVKWIF